MNAQPLSLIIHPAKADLLVQIRALEEQIARLDEEKVRITVSSVDALNQ